MKLNHKSEICGASLEIIKTMHSFISYCNQKIVKSTKGNGELTQQKFVCVTLNIVTLENVLKYVQSQQ